MRFSSSSAALLALCVANSNALPTADLVPRRTFMPPDGLPPFDESIPGCKGATFPPTIPPTIAEMRCRGINEVDRRDIALPLIQPRRTFMPPEGLPPIDESIPGCKGATFPPTIPPTIAEMRCRGINEVDRRDIALPPIQPRRTFMPPEGLPPIDESIPGCKGATFPPTIPPTIAEMRCRGINEVDRRAIALPPIDENILGCKGVSFPDVYPPSAAEMRCRGLPEGVMRRSAEDKRAPWTFGELLPPIDQTIPGCKDVAFPDIYPPSTAELMCRGVVGQDGKAKVSN